MAFKASLDLKKEKLSGIALTPVTKTGLIKLENNSKVDTKINISFSILTNGEKRISSLKFLKKTGDELKDVIVNITKWAENRVLTLSSGENNIFHIYNLRYEDVYTTFIALRLTIEEKKQKYYVLSFSGKKAEADNEIRMITFPHAEWVVRQSFAQ